MILLLFVYNIRGHTWIWIALHTGYAALYAVPKTICGKHGNFINRSKGIGECELKFTMERYK